MVRKNILFLFLLIGIFSLACVSASQNYEVGEIASDLSVYSCYPSCIAYINLTVNGSSSLANEIWDVSLNNTAEDSPIEYNIDWYDGGWVNQSANNTFINGSNYNLTSGLHQFRINITLPSALSTVWNVSFNIDDSDYPLSLDIDSINLNSPATYNITEDQTPSFNFTLFSDNWATQTCILYTRLNDAGSWVAHTTNTSTLNEVSTELTATTLSEGNYTWKINCNSSGDSASRWIYIDDTTDPVISSVVTSVSAFTVEVTWTTNEVTNSTVNYGEDSDLEDSETSSSFVTSHSITIDDLSDSTEYYYNITSCDPYGNCDYTAITDFTTPTYDPGYSGGNTAGNTASTTSTKTWVSLAKNSTSVWRVNNIQLGIKQINITINNATRNVRLVVSRKTSNPVSVSLDDNVYKYFSVTATNLANLSEAALTLQVNRTWAEEIGKNKISLFKFDNSTSQWNKVTTSYDSEDTNYYYYIAKIPSFSYFAIAGEVEEVVVSNSSGVSSGETNGTDTVGAVDAGDDEEGGGNSKIVIIVLLIVIAVLAVAVAGYIIYRQFFKKKAQ